MGVGEGDAVIAVEVSDGREQIFIGTRDGMAIRFEESDVRSMGRTAYGVRGITLRDDDEVVAMEVVRQDGTILTVAQNGYGKRTELEEYRLQSRGGVGIINIQTSDRNGKVVGMAYVHDDDEVMLISQQGHDSAHEGRRHPLDRPGHAGRQADRDGRGRRGRLCRQDAGARGRAEPGDPGRGASRMTGRSASRWFEFREPRQQLLLPPPN